MNRESEDIDLLARIGWLYYKENLNQDAISRKLNLSRSKIVRFLKRAREKGIIHFHVVSSSGNVLQMEKDLISAFGLQDAMVVPSSADDKINQTLGKAAAQYLERHLNSHHLLAMGWGTTISQIANFIRPDNFKKIRIVNLIGGLTTSLYLNPYEIGGRFASLCQGECYYIPAPAIAATEELCTSFKSELTVQQALDIARLATYFLVGIGQAGSQATLVKTGFIGETETEVLRRQGAVGNILAQFFNIEGEKINCALHRRIIAFPIEELKKMSHVIGIAGGKEKIKSILGALQGKLINILITDENTARAVLDLQKQKDQLETESSVNKYSSSEDLTRREVNLQ